MECRALDFLKLDPLFHADMILPIKRKTAEIIYAGRDGVFLRETESGAFMLSVNSFEKGKMLVDSVGIQELFSIHRKDVADYLIEKYSFQNHLICFQAVYPAGKVLQRSSGGLEIRRLDPNFAQIIFANYHTNIGLPYISERLSRGEIYGGFLNGGLCGFVGTHAEGSIGLLEVFDGFKRQGFGAELTAFMVNLQIERGCIPFAQISAGNESSVRLHEKVGFDISADTLHWLY